VIKEVLPYSYQESLFFASAFSESSQYCEMISIEHEISVPQAFHSLAPAEKNEQVSKASHATK
jgi:hypothetical protein